MPNFPSMGAYILTGMSPGFDEESDPPPHLCDGLRNLLTLDGGRGNVSYTPFFREYAITLDPEPVPAEFAGDPYALEGSKGDQVMPILFCPFDGTKLPPSLRSEWFDELDARGVEPSEGPFPDAFTTSRWWRDHEA